MFARIIAFGRRNALGLIAIFIALSGTAYAATSLPHNSVGTKQLRNGAVTGAKLARAAVTASKVKPGSLTGKQINAATLGLVPNATHATSADSATTANTANTANTATSATTAIAATNATNANHATDADHASNADHATDAAELGGETPGDFAPASEVLSSGWKTASNCGTNCAVNVDLVDNGTYDLVAGCQGNTSGNGALTFLLANPIGVTGTYFEAFSHTQDVAPDNAIFFTSVTGTTTTQIDAVNFDLVSADGKSLAGTVTAIANYPSPGQCAFRASAISG
jgi:hypothetical protein